MEGGTNLAQIDVTHPGFPFQGSLRRPSMLPLEGDGQLGSQRQFTGAAFVVSQTGALISSCHLALPREDDARVTPQASYQGFRGAATRFSMPGVRTHRRTVSP